MTSFQHIDQAVDALETAIISYSNARRIAEFNSWPQKHIERLDLLKRATAKVRSEMICEMPDNGQQELFAEEVA